MKYQHKIIALVSAFVLLAASPSRAQFFVFQNPLVGEAAPEFKLKNVGGQAMSLTDFRAGQSTIIFFWATWCPHCREQLKTLKAQKEALTQKGIKILMVDIQESPQQVNGYLKKNKIDYEVLLDTDATVAEDYALVGVPTFFFVGADGIIKAVEHDIPSNYEAILAAK